ncbi:MAG: hypothetical protein PVJ76_07120 [Gemmatimonadota bacterium]|jgi:hypothetical protein
MGNSVKPPLTVAPPPKPADDVAKLIQFIPGPYVLGPLTDPPRFRSFVAALIRTYHGFGQGKITSGDKPPIGRPEAYGYLLFPFVGDEDSRAGYARSCPKDKSHSSCGVTVRSLWLLLGARHAVLNPPYRKERVMTYVRAFAVLNNAYRGDEGAVIHTAMGDGRITREEAKGVHRPRNGLWIPELTWDTFNPQSGDVLFMEKTQHMSTVVEIVKEKDDESIEVLSCDGGQATPGDGKCCGISLIKRTITRRHVKKDWGELLKDSTGKEVRGWADVTKLKFSANFYTIYRNPGRLNLPDPEPIET